MGGGAKAFVVESFEHAMVIEEVSSRAVV